MPTYVINIDATYQFQSKVRVDAATEQDARRAAEHYLTLKSVSWWPEHCDSYTLDSIVAFNANQQYPIDNLENATPPNETTL